MKSNSALLHGRLLSRRSAHLGAFVHVWRRLGNDAGQLRARDVLVRLGDFELEHLKLIRARREGGRQLALPDQLRTWSAEQGIEFQRAHT